MATTSTRIGKRKMLQRETTPQLVQSDIKSRRAKAVEPTGIICPLWIAKITRSISDRDSLKGLPDGIGQIGAGFHHDYQIAAAGDIEPELIRLKTETAVASLCLRIP